MDDNNDEKIDEFNIGLMLEDINEFLQLYLFKGEVLNSSNVKKLFELSDEDLTTLKAVHFMLSEEVRNLIQFLPQIISLR